MLGSSFTFNGGKYPMAFSTPGALSAMTQNSNGTVQYSYVTQHRPEDIMSENYFIHSAHILHPGDSIRVVIESSKSITFADLVVTKSHRTEVIVADWHKLPVRVEGGLSLRRATFEKNEPKKPEAKKPASKK